MYIVLGALDSPYTTYSWLDTTETTSVPIIALILYMLIPDWAASCSYEPLQPAFVSAPKGGPISINSDPLEPYIIVLMMNYTKDYL